MRWKDIVSMRIIINPDQELVAEINKQLAEKDGYCPCAIEHTPDTKCMCKIFREQKEGECPCGKFIKV